ncbi:MAG: flagellar biosynthesis protein [Bacteroidota bacterium]|nr:flagellar biosynthesis protein [Bacteroidota bacterium]
MMEEKNKILKAVALKYKAGDDRAPKQVASGAGRLAEKIVKAAMESDIPIYQNPELANILSGIGLFEEIPARLYGAVAEILAFIYKVDMLEDDSILNPGASIA